MRLVITPHAGMQRQGFNSYQRFTFLCMSHTYPHTPTPPNILLLAPAWAAAWEREMVCEEDIYRAFGWVIAAFRVVGECQHCQQCCLCNIDHIMFFWFFYVVFYIGPISHCSRWMAAQYTLLANMYPLQSATHKGTWPLRHTHTDTHTNLYLYIQI